jgi:N6-L-threonylcarbamoyladenine synthase
VNQTLLAIETSCDETAAAVLRGPGSVLSHVVASQAELHAAFGGVVPEVASRNHLLLVPGVVQSALGQAGIRVGAIDAFAATTGPGLAAALLVGASAARGLALGARKPFVAVNHMEGHLVSPFFGETTIPPHIALIVSGGHTLLIDVTGHRRYEILGRTVDDAAGEAFDKVAKLLGLGYPGGGMIDRLARSGDRTAVDFPRGMRDSGSLDFSFSGLKTAVRYHREKFPDQPVEDVCASFQEAVVEVLVEKSLRAAAERGRSRIAVSGGVSSNARLQEAFRDRSGSTTLHFAEPALRTDNALMIAFCASLQLADSTLPTSAEVEPNFAEAWRVLGPARD